MARPTRPVAADLTVGYLFSRPATVALDIAAWAAISALAGYAAHRLPVARLEHDWRIHRPRRFERGGEWYARRLRVKRWKHWLPEAGGLFRGGFDKRRLGPPTPDRLARHLVETRRAELAHWLCIAGVPTFLLWNPWWVALAMAVYAALANAPCIAVVRFNRFRLQRILRKTSPAPR